MLFPVMALTRNSRAINHEGRSSAESKKPGKITGLIITRRSLMEYYAVGETERAFTRAARRETLRDAVLECSTPLLAARASSG